MFLKNKRLARRTFLQGCGATLALPFLDIMAVPKAEKGPLRVAFFYTPNGYEQSHWHIKEDKTTSDFELSPTLKPLEAMRKKIGIYSLLDRTKVPGTDGHAQCGSCWLSSAKPTELSPAGYPLKKTLDQIIAAETGKTTAFRSLELSCNSFNNNKESIYFDAISWYGHGHVASSLKDPRKIFNRLFAVKEQKNHQSILDIVKEDAKDIKGKLGKVDRSKLEEYMDSLRTVETQIERIEKKQGQLSKLNLKAPLAAAMTREQYIQIIGDLMILAFQTDLTRVASIMVGPERWDNSVKIDGLWEGKSKVHHSLTHKQGNEVVKRDLQELDRFHITQYANLVEKMDKVKEADGQSLLDNSMFLLGSGLSSARLHIQTNLPTVIAGSAGGRIKTNRFAKYEKGTPISNLWLSMAQIMGVKIDSHGDSTEPLKDFLV